jgi:hypothetical protein
VIPDLGRIVEDATGRGSHDDVFERFVLELRTRYQIIEIGHVCGMVFIVMKFQRLGRNMRLKSILGVGESGQFVIHCRLLEARRLISTHREVKAGLGQ